MATGATVALLRGINVGGKNKLPMNDLAELFTETGCSDVRTYIQSGNVVFCAPSTVVRSLPARVADAVERRFGFRVRLVLRSGVDLQDVVARNPFLRRRGVDPRTLHVGFLATKPTAARVAALDPDRSPPDEFQVRGREIYLFCPNGMGRTKLTNDYFDSKLATVSTVRNWHTVLTLCEWAAAG